MVQLGGSQYPSPAPIGRRVVSRIAAIVSLPDMHPTQHCQDIASVHPPKWHSFGELSSYLDIQPHDVGGVRVETLCGVGD